MAVSSIAGSTDSNIYLKSTDTPSSTDSTKSSSSSSFTLTDFYTLLAAQLKNQSMYDSTDNSQYITQMVQFAMLSQMQSMTNSVDSSTALSMVGKTVSLSSTGSDGTATTSSGTVNSVKFESGTPYLYKMSEVTAVSNASSAASPTVS